ncbi:MAG: DUF402 domain-containing protein [Acidobacteria bacterium]|nr:DUF402 domain-containing protein [Acidobacteriota bacterium]
MTDQVFTINSRSFDNNIRRSWQCELVRREGSLLVFVGTFDKEVHHPDLGTVRKGTVSYEYYWLDRWYNVFCFYEPEGEFRNWYCNVNMPPVLNGSTLDYIDLDIDVLVWPDGSQSILDMDEFEINSERFGYPQDVCAKAEKACDEILSMIKTNAFPFDLKSTELPAFRSGI